LTNKPDGKSSNRQHQQDPKDRPINAQYYVSFVKSSLTNQTNQQGTLDKRPLSRNRSKKTKRTQSISNVASMVSGRASRIVAGSLIEGGV